MISDRLRGPRKNTFFGLHLVWSARVLFVLVSEYSSDEFVLPDFDGMDEMYGDVLQRDVDRVIDEEILLDEAVRNVWKVLTSDQYLVKFWDMVNTLNIEYNELRPGNIGTDFKTRTKFLIIDI